MSLITRARNFAAFAHDEQKYDNKSHLFHLDGVVEIIKTVTEDETVIAVGYLHDTIEDTDTSPYTLKYLFNVEIARNVLMCTKKGSDNRANLVTVNNEAFSKINDTMYTPALIVKPADRLFNTKHSFNYGPTKKFLMYFNEYPAFKEAVYRDGICDSIWERSDKYCANAGIVL